MHPYKFVHAWAGVPSTVLQHNFLEFFKPHFHLCASRIRTEFEEELEDLDGFEDYLRDHSRTLAREQYACEVGLPLELDALIIYSRWGEPQLNERRGVVLRKRRDAAIKMQEAYLHV